MNHHHSVIVNELTPKLEDKTVDRGSIVKVVLMTHALLGGDL